MRYKYTPKQMKTLVDNIVIIFDTREQKNQHILDYFEKKNIKYKSRKLDEGDYTFYIESNAATKELGIMRDTWFDDKIIIERKASLEEISGNLTEKGSGHSERKRFENELIRAKGRQLYLIIENGSYSDIITHLYDTNYDPQALLGSLNAFQHRYNFHIACIGSNRFRLLRALRGLQEQGLINQKLSDEALDEIAKQYTEDKNRESVGCYIFQKFKTYLQEYFKTVEE